VIGGKSGSNLSGDELTTAARQEEKNTASQDQAGQSSPDDGAGDGVEVSYQTHSVRASVEEHALAAWKRQVNPQRPAVGVPSTRYHIQEQRARARVIREWRASRECFPFSCS
jgi:hypothetical protein